MAINDKHGHTMLLNTSNGHTHLIEIGLLYRLFQHPLAKALIEMPPNKEIWAVNGYTEGFLTSEDPLHGVTFSGE